MMLSIAKDIITILAIDFMLIKMYNIFINYRLEALYVDCNYINIPLLAFCRK